MRRLVMILALLLLSFGNADAETLKLSIKDAMNMALQNNNRIKAAGFSSKASGQAVESVNSRYLPAISFEETLAVSNSPTNTFMMKLDEGRFTQNDFQISNLNNPSVGHDFKTALKIEQPLFVPYLSLLKEMAVKNAEKSELQREAISQDIAFQVFATYLDVQKSEARLKAAARAVGDARENMRLATVRRSAGVGLRSDELRARTHLSLVEQQHISAYNDLTLSRMKLAMLVGLPDENAYEVSGLLDSVSIPPLSEQIIKTALENRSEIKQSEVDLEKSGAAIKIVKSEYLPTLGAFASYQLNGKDAPFTSDNDAWTAGISLKWNIFDGFRRGSEHKLALSNQAAARETLEATTKEVRYQLKESYLRREEAGKQLEVARHSVLDAEETLRLLAKRYENSLATMVEILDAQTALNQIRANLVETEASYALAGGRIHYIAGTFVREILK